MYVNNKKLVIMNHKFTHIQVVGKGKGMTLVPFYNFHQPKDKENPVSPKSMAKPTGLALDLRTGIELLAFQTFYPSCSCESPSLGKIS